MDAVTIITEHLDVDRLLQHYDFDKINPDGDIVRACCKIHGGNNPTAFVINRETGLWYCHTGSCGGGDVFTLVQKMESCDFPSAVRWLANFFDIDINNLRITERKYQYVEELKSFIKTVKSKRKKVFQQFTIEEEIKEVTKYRDFKPETLEHFHLGYVESVKLKKRDGAYYTLLHRLVFPISFNNIQVGISFRRTNSNDFPKWSHQPAHIETKELLYNYDEAKSSQIIAICEGISDVWAFYEIGVSAVCTFGAHITQEQYKLLLKTGADLVLAYDGDEAGKLVTERALKMFKYKANLYTIHLNDSEDPQSIGREELLKRYESRTRH